MNKRKQIRERVIAEAEYIMRHEATIRETAKHFAVSKSTVWVDMQQRLLKYAPLYVPRIAAIFEHNFVEKSRRGGEITRKRWKARREEDGHY